MARYTKIDECKTWAGVARRLEEDAAMVGVDDLVHLASYAVSDFLNANECLLSASAADKRSGGGGSGDGWSLRREAKGLMTRGRKRIAHVRAALDEARHGH